MFDQLWDESPMVQNMKQQAEAKGEVKTLQRMLVKEVQKRFPQLTELTQAKVRHVNEPGTLETLYDQVRDAPDALTVQQLLVAISEEQDS